MWDNPASQLYRDGRLVQLVVVQMKLCLELFVS
jgi:hypothetical protein